MLWAFDVPTQGRMATMRLSTRHLLDKSTNERRTLCGIDITYVRGSAFLIRSLEEAKGAACQRCLKTMTKKETTQC